MKFNSRLFFNYFFIFSTLWVVINCSDPNPILQVPISGFEKPENNNRNRLFDSDWLFFRGEASGAEELTFDDKNWRILDLPHDWSIEDVPIKEDSTAIGPFSRKSPGKSDTGHTLGGTGWYRKHFSIDKEDEGKKFTIMFDGAYMNSEVWINGHYLGKRPSGYSPFYYDISPYLMPTKKNNILAVKINNDGENSRWYTGSGIYRHVYLIVTEKTHFVPWGITVTTPDINQDQATVQLKLVLSSPKDDNSDLSIKSRIYNEEGIEVASVATKVSNDQELETGVQQSLLVKDPSLWSDESPVLYSAKVEVWKGEKLLDNQSISFGIRSILFSPEEGMLVNGRSVKLRGGSLHHDNGILGSVAYDRAEERKIELLKKNGYNAIRTSHNPVSTSFLEACDRLGMYVIEEAFDVWRTAKKPQDYHLYFQDWWEKDLEAIIKRDKNHPSIIAWGIGNEVPEEDPQWFYAMTDSLANKTQALDNTRPSTNAVCCFDNHERNHMQEVLSLTEIQSYNYQWSHYENDRKDYPNRIFIGSETFPKEAYDNEIITNKYPWIIGSFVWTAMDYFGETGIGRFIIKNKGEDDSYPGLGEWPWINAWCGDFDICGFKKPQSFYRDILWENSDLEIMVHAPLPKDSFEIVSLWGWPNELNHWNWEGSEGQPLKVNVYSRNEEVRLELNGVVVGIHKLKEEDRFTATFNVPYQEGMLRAIALQDGVEVAQTELVTAKKATAIKLTADRSRISSDKNDMSFVTATLVDKDGNRVTNADVTIEFLTSEQGELIASGNSDPKGVQSFQDGYTSTFQGRGLAIVRAKHKAESITLTAKAEGMDSAQLNITID